MLRKNDKLRIPQKILIDWGNYFCYYHQGEKYYTELTKKLHDTLDNEEFEIIRLKYIKKWTVRKISLRLHYHERAIYNKQREILKKIESLL